MLDERWRLRSLLAFGLAIALLFLFLSRLQVDPASIIAAIKGADGRFLILAFAVYYSTFPLRAWRWRLLLQNAGVGRDGAAVVPPVLSLARMIFLSWFANCVIPAKLGDAYRGYQIRQAAGVSFSTAMGTVVAERLLDVAVLVGLLIVAAANLRNSGAFGRDQFAGRVVEGGLLLVALGALGLGLMWALRGKLHSRLPTRLQARYQRFQEGTLASFSSLAAVGPLTLVVWLAEASRLFLVAQALSLGLPFSYAIFLALTNSLLTVVPFTPGGLGLVEAGVVGLLLLVGTDKDAAVATALVDRSITYWSIIVLGLPLFLFRRRI